MKAFADVELTFTPKHKFVFDKVQDIEGKGEKLNAGYQHFLPLPHVFKSHHHLGSFKPEIVFQRVNKYLQYDVDSFKD